MAENLKTIQKAAKKNKKIVTELDKLGVQDMKVLNSQVAEIKKELDDLKAEWDEYKKPIGDEIFEQK